MRAAMRSLVAATLAAAVTAAVANLLLRVLGVEALGVDGDFEPLAVRAVVLSSVVAVVAAGLVFALLARTTRDPLRVFLPLAGVLLVLSLIPPLTVEDGDAAAKATLAAMHVITAAICVAAFTAAWRRRPRRG